MLGLVLVLAIYGQFDARPGKPNTFLNGVNLVEGVATPMSYYAIMAMGLTIVIIAGGIDISVGSTLALAGFITAWALQQFPKDAPWYTVGLLSLFLPLLIGLTCGLVNGALVVGLRVHAFIITLGTMSILRGTCNVLPFGVKTLPKGGQALPDASVTHLFQQKIWGLEAWPMLVTLAVVAAGWVYLRHTAGGREVYAVGGNEEAARFSGINVNKVKLKVYAISGLLAGLAGLVTLGKFGTISTSTATGYELSVVAAAVVGGASLSGGRGTALGALLGTLVLALIENGIAVLGIDQNYKSIIVGMSIIAAVALDRLGESLKGRQGR